MRAWDSFHEGTHYDRDGGANGVAARAEMNPGGFRSDMTRSPGPILGMFVTANAALRGAWTPSERLRELVRLYSAFEHECHT